MSRWLVENKEVDVAPHQHTQAQAASLAAGERADGGEHVLAAKAEGGETVARLLRLTVTLVAHDIQHRRALIGKAHGLRQIGLADRGAEAQIAAVRRLLAEDQLQERGLPGAVIANERDTLAAAQREAELIKEPPFAVGLADIVGDQHLVALELALLELGVHLALGAGLIALLELLDALFHRKGALMELVRTHKGPQVHLRGSACELFDLGLILFILLELFVKAALSLLHVKAVVAAVKLGLAFADLDAALHDAI